MLLRLSPTYLLALANLSPRMSILTIVILCDVQRPHGQIEACKSRRDNSAHQRISKTLFDRLLQYTILSVSLSLFVVAQSPRKSLEDVEQYFQEYIYAPTSPPGRILPRIS